MRLTGNTILITGGATGIGLVLAQELLKPGNEVIICGRRQSRLEEARAANPGLHIRVCDVSDHTGRTIFVDECWLNRGLVDMTKQTENVVSEYSEEGVDVPYEQISSATLRALIEEFVSREWSELKDGRLIKSIHDIDEKDIITTRVADGTLISEVTAKECKND
jgi:NAD(P)-dependent dehydrogenase (short-subunit alcohol dehydrogenase family)